MEGRAFRLDLLDASEKERLGYASSQGFFILLKNEGPLGLSQQITVDLDRLRISQQLLYGRVIDCSHSVAPSPPCLSRGRQIWLQCRDTGRSVAVGQWARSANSRRMPYISIFL